MKKVRLDNIPDCQLKSQDQQTLYSVVKSVSDSLDLETLLIHFEVLAPGNFSAKPHAHTTKDEVFIITSGEGHVIVDGTKQLVNEGDIISFAGADSEVHVIQNTSESPLNYISIATNPSDDMVNYQTGS